MRCLRRGIGVQPVMWGDSLCKLHALPSGTSLGTPRAGMQERQGLLVVSEGLFLKSASVSRQMTLVTGAGWDWLLPALSRAPWHPGPLPDPRPASQGSRWPVAGLRTLPSGEEPLGVGHPVGPKVLC